VDVAGTGALGLSASPILPCQSRYFKQNQLLH